MAKDLGKPVIVDNRPGAGGTIGATAAARAKNDGHTIVLGTVASHGIATMMFPNVAYNPVKDFAPITLATSYPLIVEATPSFPAKDMRELIATLKAEGAKINVAYPALPSQVAGELLKSVLGVQFTGVNYKGGAPALQDVMAGHVPLVIDALGPSLPHVKSGKVKPYAVTSKQRSAALPNVPTFTELGYPEMEVITWVGYLAPAGTRNDIVKKLNEEFVRVLKLPDVRERFASLGTDIHGTTPEEFAAQIRSDTAKFGKVIKAANIKVE